MKNLIKNRILFIFSLILLGSIVSCNDTSELDEGTITPVGEPYEVSLGFGLILEPTSDGLQAKTSSVEHNYEKTGYKVDIKGGLVGPDLKLEDVDLTQPIVLEVTGAVEVTVKHPDFKKKKLGTVAYYGLKNVDLETYEGGGMISVPLELVQGFVSVNADTTLGYLIEKVKIGKDEVELNTVYYTDETKKDLKIKVEVFDNEIKGEHANVIGEGVVYEVTWWDAIGGNSQSAKNLEFEDLYFDAHRYN